MSAYENWLAELVRRHAHLQRGHKRRLTGCWVCDCLDVPETDRVRCRELSVVLDGHHVIAKSLLKREFPRGATYVTLNGVPTWVTTDRLPPAEPRPYGFPVPWRAVDDILWDPRNGVPVRRWHHDALESGALKIPRGMVPLSVEEFAQDYGLVWLLDRSRVAAVPR